MPFDVSVAESTLTAELAKIGVAPERVSITQVDSGSAFVVTIVASAFEGRTYLDREMRVRSAVTRMFISQRLPRASFTIEAQTPDEAATEEAVSQEVSGGVEEEEQERVNRRAWRERRSVALAALSATRYTVSQLEENAFVATRTQLAEEKLLIAFASSPNAKVVDLDTRKVLQTARQSQRFSQVFYIVPHDLENPFANQPKAEWLRVATVERFLHLLNGSSALADTQRRLTPVDPRPSALGIEGPVIEPDVKEQGGAILEGKFFEVVDRWVRGDKPSMLVLLAPAGHGKTTLTLELTRRFAERFAAAQESAPVPLLVPFESVRRTVDFEALMHKRLAELHGGSFGAFLELLKLNEGVLFVDGFDELADDAGIGVAESQIRSMRPLMHGRAKVLLAGRSLFAQQFAGEQGVADRVKGLLGDIDVQVLEIVPFSEEQIRDYVETRIGLTQANVAEVIEFAEATPDHVELCANPLFLKTLCVLAATGKIPRKHEVASGVDLLIDKICEREEERQQLGLGVKGQLEFLMWIATDLFRSGSLSLPDEEVRIVAGMVAESFGRKDNEVVGRLADHALLTSRSGGTVHFIHPFFRDVILGRAIANQITGKKEVAFDSTLAARDLPVGTVHHLARHAAGMLCYLPGGWLSELGGLSATIRRNLFRVAVDAARFRVTGNPRQWVEKEWIQGARVRGLDLSNLVVESVAFDGMELSNVDLSYSLLDDCDLRGTKWSGCTLTLATFWDCRFDQRPAIERCEVGDVELRFGANLVRASSESEFIQAIARFGEAAEVRREVSPAAVAAARELIRAVLGQFLDPERSRFFEAGIKTLREVAHEDPARTAVTKVIIPGVLTVFCDTHLGRSSREVAGIAKQWRGAVMQFVKDGRMTPAMDDAASKLVAKSARYL